MGVGSAILTGMVVVGAMGVGAELAAPGSSAPLVAAVQNSTTNVVTGAAHVAQNAAPEVGAAAKGLLGMIPQTASAVAPAPAPSGGTAPSTTLPLPVDDNTVLG